jgi:hypothetical protein
MFHLPAGRRGDAAWRSARRPRGRALSHPPRSAATPGPEERRPASRWIRCMSLGPVRRAHHGGAEASGEQCGGQPNVSTALAWVNGDPLRWEWAGLGSVPGQRAMRCQSDSSSVHGPSIPHTGPALLPEPLPGTFGRICRVWRRRKGFRFAVAPSGGEAGGYGLWRVIFAAACASNPRSGDASRLVSSATMKWSSG